MGPRGRLAGAVAVAVVGAMLISGCGEDVGERLAERAVENRLGDGAEVDLDGQELRIDDGSGNSYVGGDKLPDSFPDQIPLVDGTVLTGSAMDNQGQRGWSVNVEVDGTGRAAFDAAVEKLVGAGFEHTVEMPEGTMTAQLDDGTWGIVVSVYADPSSSPATVGYIVGPSTS